MLAEGLEQGNESGGRGFGEGKSGAGDGDELREFFESRFGVTGNGSEVEGEGGKGGRVERGEEGDAVAEIACEAKHAKSWEVGVVERGKIVGGES